MELQVILLFTNSHTIAAPPIDSYKVLQASLMGAILLPSCAIFASSPNIMSNGERNTTLRITKRCCYSLVLLLCIFICHILYKLYLAVIKEPSVTSYIALIKHTAAYLVFCEWRYILTLYILYIWYNLTQLYRLHCLYMYVCKHMLYVLLFHQSLLLYRIITITPNTGISYITPNIDTKK